MRHEREHLNAGKKSQPPHYRFETDRYEHFQVIYISTGVLHYRDQHGQTALTSGGIALLRETSAFTLWTENTGYAGVYFIAIGDPRPEFRGGSAAFKGHSESRTLAHLMEREIATPGRNSEALLLSLGWALCWQAIRLHDIRTLRADSPAYPRHMAECARQSLDATIYSGQSAREVLSSFSLSYRQLARHFDATFHLSPKRYQLEARIREAQRLLRGTQRSITSIAYELGYSSSQHFASQFQALTRQTPSKYRAAQG
jgi:AraC-like DNA-binding protein